MEIESRNLKLKTSWISSSVDANTYYDSVIDNSAGKIENNNQSYTWYNVNLRQALGDAYYNKYTKFSLKSIEIKNTFLATTYNVDWVVDLTPTRYDNTSIEYYLSGLNFDPSVNSVIVQMVAEPILPRDSAGAGFITPAPTRMDQTPVYYFTKPAGSDTVNIKIDRMILNTQQPPIINYINDMIGPSIFMFEIVGIN